MNTNPTDGSDHANVGPTAGNEILLRILAAVERDKRRGSIELLLAIILSLTTLATTWCGYQAGVWGHVQSSRQAEGDTAERKGAEETIVGLQLRTFDALVIQEYWAALRESDTNTIDALRSRMRPQLRTALDASLAAGVLNDPTVPGPLQRPEYILPQEQDAKKLREVATQANLAAQIAGRTSGEYVLLTLMFASVLFFGGITGTFTARRVRIGLACVALLVFLITMLFLARLPVSPG